MSDVWYFDPYDEERERVLDALAGGPQSVELHDFFESVFDVELRDGGRACDQWEFVASFGDQRGDDWVHVSMSGIVKDDMLGDVVVTVSTGPYDDRRMTDAKVLPLAEAHGWMSSQFAPVDGVS